MLVRLQWRMYVRVNPGLFRHSPFSWFPTGAVESALSAQAAGKHTGWSERILRPGEPGETPAVAVLWRASVQPCDGGCGDQHPAATHNSASYCLRIALSSRMGGEERGGSSEARRWWWWGGPSPFFQFWPIAALLRREPPRLAVSVQTMMPSGAVWISKQVQKCWLIKCQTGRRLVFLSFHCLTELLMFGGQSENDISSRDNLNEWMNEWIYLFILNIK